jgi:hypothetical protein
MTRPTVYRAITEDLGYCCPWFFFTHFKRTSTIALRLGFSQRQVQMLKAQCVNGERPCEGKDSCMHKLITLEGSPRKLTSTARSGQCR